VNLPQDHPARDLQDTLYIQEPDVLLRTHTSSVEGHILEKETPPYRYVVPGKVYRYENANDMGMVVTDFLDEHFKEIMHYSFTAEVEDKLDEIAEGKQDWEKTVDTYYKPFVKTVLKTLEIAEKATGERVLGKDPKTGRTVLVRLSKFGPVAQIGTPEELGEEKPHYAGLMLGQSIETITFEDAMKLFELPKSLGMLNDKEVMINRGRFGPYIKYGEDYDGMGLGTQRYLISYHPLYHSTQQEPYRVLRL
jgi:DNA topoisomerase-1